MTRSHSFAKQHVTLIGLKFFGSEDLLPVFGIMVIFAIFHTSGRVLFARLAFRRCTRMSKNESGNERSIMLCILLSPEAEFLFSFCTCFFNSFKETGSNSTTRADSR
jgi:hypothetical protein